MSQREINDNFLVMHRNHVDSLKLVNKTTSKNLALIHELIIRVERLECEIEILRGKS